ncbi:tyrosine-type recombinase/integrase [Cellulosilyticum lentocellum]|uniref:Integrase family protein n=1 Tax=Cellulosilyticum lentocellum (strain ATCC 49066 / DSM 5427 / NCIMB 11756 / RHM5) TaxID=642492 RepID=F2JNV0_CELLD|nr:tyrosine-type recombinase/integrase [Cellulosilyticum lentocellum]ADZ82448.1 integrase family protein [Cellulosilyticum lentocellum DSM 5427]
MSMDLHGNVWRFRIMKDGIPYTKLFEGTEKKAKEAHEAFKVDVKRGNVGTNENMKFNELCQLVTDQYVKVNCKYSTVEFYKNTYNTHLLPFFGDKKLSSIKPLHIQQFVTHLSELDLAPSTVSNNLSCLKKTFEMAVKWELIIKNPCMYVDRPQKRKYQNRGQLMTVDEMKKLLEIYENLSTKPSHMHKCAFYIALGCGLRNSEIRALTLDDIDFENNIIRVNKQFGKYTEKGKVVEGYITTKSESSIRDIYAPDFVIAAIKNYISTLDCIPLSKQLFWSARTNKPVGRQCLSTFFTNILKNNNLPVIDFHDLRHLHATLLASKGVNMKSLSNRMGHSKLETTNIYMQPINEVDKQVAKVLDNTIVDIKNNNFLSS